MNCVTTWEELLRKVVLPHEVGELVIRWYKGTIMATFYPEDICSTDPVDTTLVIQKDLEGFCWTDIRNMV